MTRVLLDTHVLLWALMEPDRLSDRARRRLVDGRTIVLVSAASAWEIAAKYRLGKLAGADEVVTSYHDHLRTLGADELSVTSSHALTAGAFAVDHRDLFDRMLAAQALLESVPLVTSDPVFERFPMRTLW